MSDGEKKRHGCLTAFLVVGLIGNALAALGNIAGGDAIRETLPADAPSWGLPLLALAGVFNIVCIVALWKWKKWGFLGFVASSVVALMVNLMMGMGLVASVMGLFGIAVLYGVLQIGDEKTKGWNQLE